MLSRVAPDLELDTVSAEAQPLGGHMKRLVIACFMTAAVVAVAQPQDSLLGTYTGAYTHPSGARLGLRLVITTADNDRIKGTAILYDGPCRGQYPMEGKFEDNKLVMKATARGPTADCFFSFTVMREGNKLVGEAGPRWPLQLSK